MKSTGKGQFNWGRVQVDPDLLTIKALGMLEKSDVVVYDRLVSTEILAYLPKNAKKNFSWKITRQSPRISRRNQQTPC